MLFSLLLSASAAALANGSVMRRQDQGQTIPSTAKADNTFNNGAPMLAAEPPETGTTPPAIYGARDTDIPFARLYHGNGKFFPPGQLNSPDGVTDKWYTDGSDSASQSACGIPDNAYSISKVAIHPYFLKYADLSREQSNRNQRSPITNIPNRILYARCLHFVLEGRWFIRHDAQSYGYLQYRSQRSNLLRNPRRHQD